MDTEFNEVLESLVTEGNLMQIVGLYGMGGVGKKTLLHKINSNEFVERKQFDLVIFSVVSKDLNLAKIQNQIGKKLGISWTGETEVYQRANDIFKLLRHKKFLLLLDDIWEGIDLETIGVSKNTIQITGSKVLFTTRSQQVCGFMEADKRIKIVCLKEDHAWSLFQHKVKEEALNCHPHVLEVAKKVAKECCGLPLALIIIGRTMSSKTDLQQWQYALHTLRESASQFTGMADKVLAIMKYSYDNLESQKLKSCFLHCSLYPQDLPFRKFSMIGYWIGEGLLDNVDDLIKGENEGHDVIRCLKDVCLLETGIVLGVKMEDTVKVHDIVRDLAIWVASDLGREKNKYLALQAHSTMKLHEWEKAERISLMGNSTISTLNGTPNCSNLLTLLLEGSSISIISDDFFRFMTKLIVLDMSGVILKKVPTSIFSLSKLQFLVMPKYDEDVVLRPGSLASLSKLKILAIWPISDSHRHWEVEGAPSLLELESLQHLICLEITVETGLALRRLVTNPKLQMCTKYLSANYCSGITSLTLSPSSPSSPLSLLLLSLAHMKFMICLKSLELNSFDELEELGIMSGNEVTLFTTMESLSLSQMPKLRIIWDVPHQSFFSLNLKYVIIKGCPRLKDITWLIYAQNLEVLFLFELDGLEEIISNGFATEGKFISTFSRLNSLVLSFLKNLKRIFDHNVKFFLLEKIFVMECPQLKKLPFNTNNIISQNLEKIEGSKEWWESLEWEDEDTKSNLAPCFREFKYE